MMRVTETPICTRAEAKPDTTRLGIPTTTEADDRTTTGCSGVVHTASNTSLSPDPTVVIPSSVALVLAMLRAAAVVPSIKRFVFTSSTSTLPPFLSRVSATSRDNLPQVTAGSWASDDIVEKAWGAGPPYNPRNAGAVYAASKILSEHACWDFMAKHDPAPGFTLNTIVPATQIGAFVHEDLKSSVNGLLWKVWQVFAG